MRLRTITVSILFILLVPLPAEGALYNALLEYSDQQGGTSGVWRYQYWQSGYFDMVRTDCAPSHENAWCRGEGGAYPAMWLPAGQDAISFHPGLYGGGAGYYTVLTWQAPASCMSAQVHVDFHGETVDSGDGILLSLLHNSEVLSSFHIDVGDRTSHTFDANLFVQPGDVIRLVGDPGADNYYDHYHANMVVEAPYVVPALSGWGVAMLLVALISIGLWRLRPHMRAPLTRQ